MDLNIHDLPGGGVLNDTLGRKSQDVCRLAHGIPFEPRHTACLIIKCAFDRQNLVIGRTDSFLVVRGSLNKCSFWKSEGRGLKRRLSRADVVLWAIPNPAIGRQRRVLIRQMEQQSPYDAAQAWSTQRPCNESSSLEIKGLVRCHL